MEDRQNDALLERVSNGEPVYEPPRRNSNLKAVKVTGLTVLACLLLAGQAFTAYYVMAQKDHLKALETGQDSLKKELTRRLSVSGPKMVHTPMSKMPLLLNLNEDGTKTESKMPLRKLTPSFPSQREGSGLAEGSSARLAMPMASLPILTNEKLDEDSKATELPAMVVVEPRCKLEAGKVMPGFFQPECDAEGNFKPMQCWHSTGYCWCVDKNGKEIAGTLQRGRPECNNEN